MSSIFISTTNHATFKDMSDIFVGADHGGFALKERAKGWLEARGLVVHDLGASQLDSEDDYPQYALAVAQAVRDQVGMGFLFCRSGGGMSILANKVPGIRAVTALTTQEVIKAREDNDANILNLAGDWLDEPTAQELMMTFIDTPFSGHERHQRRLEQIAAHEQRVFTNQT